MDDKIVKLSDVMPPPPVELRATETGGDTECEWLLNAFACRLGQTYSADDLKACWRALGQQDEMADGQLAFAIIKSFLKFANG